MSARILVRLFLCLILCVVFGQAQDQKQTPPQKQDDMTLRISTTLVQADVTVLDKQGRFVDGLKPDQFQVKIDGKPQRIDLFNRVTAGTPEEAQQFSAARGEAPKSDVRLTPGSTGQTIFFFVDDLHITPERVARVKSVILNYIDQEMQSGDRALIAQASGQLGFLQQLTDNKTVLRTAANRIKFNPISITDNERPRMSPYESYAIDVGKRDVLEFKMLEYRQANSGMGAVQRPALENILRQKAGNILRNVKLLNVAMLSTLETVLRGSSAVKGRKLLFFLSEGMVVDQRDREIQTRLNRVIDVAARAGAIFYTVDVRGLAVAGPEAADDVYPSMATFDPDNTFSQASAMDVAMEESFEVLRPLRALAYDTGGRPLINSNGLDKNIKQALSEYQNYYLVAWQPEEFDPGKTKFRRIEVKVKDRPDLRVMVRSGFFNNPVPEAKPEAKVAKDGSIIAEDTLKAAVRAPYERRELPFSVYPVFKNEAVGGSTVAINLEVSSTVNSPANAEHPNQEIDLVYVVLDLNGKLIATDGKKLSYAQAPGVTASLIHQFVVPLNAGTYQIRIGARDITGKISTSFDWIETPALAPGKMTLSSLLLSERKSQPAASRPATDGSAPETLLNIERRFARSSRLLLQVYIYNAARKSGGAPEVTMEIDVLRKGVSVLNAPQHPVNVESSGDADRIPYSAEIPMRGLTPGVYSLRIKAVDRTGKTEILQSANFVVE